MQELKEEYGDKRKTLILGDEPKKLSLADLVREENVVITCTHSGYIKRTSLSSFNRQRRGGKGKIGMRTKEEDFLDASIASKLTNCLIFLRPPKANQWRSLMCKWIRMRKSRDSGLLMTMVKINTSLFYLERESSRKFV
jgi:DNA gyrase/topoisomerase IV subunit A